MAGLADLLNPSRLGPMMAQRGIQEPREILGAPTNMVARGPRGITQSTPARTPARAIPSYPAEASPNYAPLGLASLFMQSPQRPQLPMLPAQSGMSNPPAYGLMGLSRQALPRNTIPYALPTRPSLPTLPGPPPSPRSRT